MEVGGDCASSMIRFKDPPPADIKPDPDYEPEVGEWFWWQDARCRDEEWLLRCRECKSVVDKNGFARCSGVNWDACYDKCCLRATAPE